MTTIPKTITINEEHEFVLKRMGWGASEVFRTAMNDRIGKSEMAIKLLQEWIDGIHDCS